MGVVQTRLFFIATSCENCKNR